MRDPADVTRPDSARSVPAEPSHASSPSVPSAAVSPTLLPTGTVTFVMTDIEGSTRLLQALGDRYPALLDDHYRVLRAAFSSSGGIEVSTDGDSLFSVFRDAASAIRAGLEGQRCLAVHEWPTGANVRVRMGIHSGEGKLLGGDYVGLDVHRAARIANAAHGGQVVVSDSARALAEGTLPEGASLRDLGQHRLRDLERAEHLFQLLASGLDVEFPPLRSAAAGTSKLPAQITSFVGREREKEQLLELLGSSRLVTLTGPGGTGKTRLSLQAAAASLDDFPDGVFFVPLATILDPDLLVPTVAAVLGVREVPARPIRDGLIEHVRDRAILLVLDNFEQLISAAPTVGELLAIAPRLKVIVTSREALRIAGEQEFPVPPLALPEGREPAGLEDLKAVDSVALFMQRARLVRPGFELTADNAHAVVEICARLDGLPLAIELAAARTRLFEPSELLHRLDQRLSFLSGGRDRPERQRTLRGAIDWSHELLAEPERGLFRRMSVFAGGCTLEAIEAVCVQQAPGVDLVDVVSSLHDKSLLRRDDTVAGGLRVTMLETIRDFARELLAASGEQPEVRRRHAVFFADLAERVAGHLRGPDQQRWLDALDRELDNFRAAIAWAIDTGEMETGARVAAPLTRFWVFRNRVMEGRRHLEELLALPARGESPAARAATLGAVADLTVWQGDYGTSRPLAEESLAMYRELGDISGMARQLNSIGYATVIADPSAALGLFRESIEAYRQAGAPPRWASLSSAWRSPRCSSGTWRRPRGILRRRVRCSSRQATIRWRWSRPASWAYALGSRASFPSRGSAMSTSSSEPNESARRWHLPCLSRRWPILPCWRATPSVPRCWTPPRRSSRSGSAVLPHSRSWASRTWRSGRVPSLATSDTRPRLRPAARLRSMR